MHGLVSAQFIKMILFWCRDFSAMSSEMQLLKVPCPNCDSFGCRRVRT